MELPEAQEEEGENVSLFSLSACEEKVPFSTPSRMSAQYSIHKKESNKPLFLSLWNRFPLFGRCVRLSGRSRFVPPQSYFRPEKEVSKKQGKNRAEREGVRS